jgi:hypothetical protein
MNFISLNCSTSIHKANLNKSLLMKQCRDIPQFNTFAMQTWIYDHESMEFPCTLVDATILTGFYVAVDREDVIALVLSMRRNVGKSLV